MMIARLELARRKLRRWGRLKFLSTTLVCLGCSVWVTNPSRPKGGKPPSEQGPSPAPGTEAKLKLAGDADGLRHADVINRFGIITGDLVYSQALLFVKSVRLTTTDGKSSVDSAGPFVVDLLSGSITPAVT